MTSIIMQHVPAIWSDYVYVGSPDTGIGQSSSVMLDQNTHSMTTERRVKSVSKSAPSILPSVP